MIDVSDEQFSQLIDESIGELPKDHMQAVQNVAIVYADAPTSEQVEKLRLRADQSLLGLYEGVPLSRRQGVTSYPPDKITIFKDAIVERVYDLPSLKREIKHTVWHELAHYFGLDHPAIHALEQRSKPQ